MIIKLFTQPNCPKCPAAKALLRQCKVQSFDSAQDRGAKCKVEEYDTTSVDGMAEASFYTVMATPTILICDDKGKIIKDFRGRAPALKEILPFVE